MAPALQTTLQHKISCVGIGLHSGQKVRMTLRPAPAGWGIRFRRIDLGVGDGVVVPALWRNVAQTNLCSTIAIAGGASIMTVEHLMAAFAGLGVDNATVDLDGPEVPAMDGSSAPFVFLLECAGLKRLDAPRRVIKITKPVEIALGDRSVALTPADQTFVAVEIDFQDAAIGRQRFETAIGEMAFKTELARARTFGFFEDVEKMRAAGFALGGSLDNAVVLRDGAVLNEGGLRFADECVRHKALDAIGDLYLAGAPIRGRFDGLRCGHTLNNMLLHRLFADPDAWAWRDDDAGDPAATAPALDAPVAATA